MAAETALVDSGATENFLDHDTAKRLGIIPRELPVPQIMNNMDGTTNQTGLVKHFYDFRLKMEEQETIQRFYIGGIGTDRFILGFLLRFLPSHSYDTTYDSCLGLSD